MAVLYLLLGGQRAGDRRRASEPAHRTDQGAAARATSYLIKSASGPRRRRRTDLLARGRRDRRRSAPDLVAGTPRSIDAGGLVALPGLVDLHTHLREPGREDAETVDTGTRAAALGGFTAVHAMANTDPVADTAGVVEQVWRLGREAGLLRRVPGRRGHRRAWPASGWPSSARWPTPRRGSGSSPTTASASPTPSLMRRALEYVKAFDGVVAQHAQEPRLTEGAQMNEGELSGEPRA